MRHRRDSETLLREYVRDVLSEEGGDSGYGGDATSAGMYGPYGVSAFGSKEDLANTFIGPFVDVFKTAVGKTKELSRKTQTLLWVGLQTVLTTLIPFYGYNYAEVFDKEKEDIEKIRGQYQDVYDKTNKALKSNDAALLAFMASPALVLGAAAAKTAPSAFKGLLSVTSGGLSDKIYDGIKEKAEAAGRWALGDDTDGKKRKSSGKSSKGKSPKGFDWGGVGESQLVEEDGGAEKADITPQKILTSKKFLAKALDAPKVKEMEKSATEIYRKTLNDVYTQADNLFKKTKTVEDIEKALKGKLKGDMQKKIDEIKKLPPEEKKKAEEMLVKGVKKAMKDFYAKNLTDQVEKVVKAGIPEDAQYVKDYRAAIQKIKSMS